MPYKKRYSKYTGAVAKRARVYGPAIGQLAKDVGYVMSLVNSETHTHIVNTGNNVDYNGVVFSLSDIPQGDGQEYRTGNTVLPRYFTCKMHVNKKITSSTADHITIRVIFFRYWGEDANGIPSVAPNDILSYIGTSYAPLSTLDSNIVGRRGDRERKIEVFHSEFHTLDPVSNTAFDIDLNREFNGPTTKNKQHMKFPSSSTTQAISGGIYCLVCTSSATASEVSAELLSKVTFYDN